MIRMVASDLDGTLLLNGAQELNPETCGYIRRLKEKGILFVAASGRQYPNLRRLFAPVADDIAYIAENGALVIYRDEILAKHPIERSLGTRILEAVQKRDACEILLSGVHTCYLQPKIRDYADHMKYVVKNQVQIVENIFQVEEEYLKISVYEKEGVDRCEQYFKELFQEEVQVLTSGHAWLDMISFEAGKGSAIRDLMNRFGISPEETLAIGDNENDIEMLKQVSYSYAMKNAKPGVKAVCKYETDLVEHTLLKLLEGQTVEKKDDQA